MALTHMRYIEPIELFPLVKDGKRKSLDVFDLKCIVFHPLAGRL